MPLGTVPARLGELPADRPVYVICVSGNRSKAASDWTRTAGIDACPVAGGTGGWARAGRAIVTGAHEDVT